jgi:hypothetical protein
MGSGVSVGGEVRVGSGVGVGVVLGRWEGMTVEVGLSAAKVVGMRVKMACLDGVMVFAGISIEMGVHPFVNAASWIKNHTKNKRDIFITGIKGIKKGLPVKNHCN